MLPTIHIFGIDIAMYSILILIGFLAGLIFAICYNAKFYNIKREDILYSSLFGIIGVGIGGKILYIITNLPYLIQNYNIINSDAILNMFKSGFVFYGGLIGGILGIFIYSKVFKISFKNLLLIIIPVVPLIHFFGRIGCLFAGCCYGKEYNGFGHIIFTNTPYAPVNVPLFPSQIVECLCNLLIFIVIFFTYKKFKGTYKSIGIYCILYGFARFILEFFRGDDIRGFLLNLSTSQWFSIVLCIIGFSIFVYEYRKNKSNIKQTI